jgi:hypothetical protein
MLIACLLSLLFVVQLTTPWISIWSVYYYYLVCEAIGTAVTPGLLCQPRVLVKMIVEKQMECRLAGETEVLGENLPQRHFRPSQNPTWPDPVLNPSRRGGKLVTNRLSYGAALICVARGLVTVGLIDYTRCSAAVCKLVLTWFSCVPQQAEKKRKDLLRFPEDMSALEDATKWVSSVYRDLGSVPCQFIWDLIMKIWHHDTFAFEFDGSSASCGIMRIWTAFRWVY